MREIADNREGPIDISEAASITGTITGDVTVHSGGELTLRGEIHGTLTVESGGSLVLMGRVKGAVINRGGAVDIFGFAGRVEDAGDTESFVSRGAIVGGKRVLRPAKLSNAKY